MHLIFGMERFVYLVDSSVILKWFLPNEEDAEKAEELYRSMRSGEIKLGTDSSVIHEVANVLHSKGSLGAREVSEAVTRIFNDGLSLIVDEQGSLIDAINIGFTRKIGTHDAVLITTAMKSKSILITADHLLYRVAREYTGARLLQEMHD